MKERYVALDGLRGLAALIVLVHHAGMGLAGGTILPSGYLAVDFFFLLSGFVVSAAYEHRFADGTAPFFKARLWRLVPTMWLGIALGTIWALWSGSDLVAIYLVAALLFIPISLGPFGVFMLNGVQWSLFFELFANAAHALCLWQLRTRTLALISLLAFFVVLGASWHFGTVSVGDRGETFLAGFPRVFASYLAGMVLFRVRLPRMKIPSPFIILPVTIVAAGILEPKWLIEPLAILLWPLVLIGGIRRSTAFPRLSTWAGAISYPLYAVHLPVIYAVNGNGPTNWVNFTIGVSLSVLLAAVVAWLLAVPKRGSNVKVGGQTGRVPLVD